MRTETEVASARVAARLVALDVERNDRVALLCGTSVDAVEVVLGCLRLGVIPVPLDVTQTRETLAERIYDVDPALVVTDEAHAHLAVGAGRVITVGEGRGGSHDALPLADLPRWPRTRPMHYTSGTTGRASGVWAGDLGVEGGQALAESERRVWNFHAGDVHLMAGPLMHSGPLRFAVNTLLWGGRIVTLHRFDAGAVLEAIAAEDVTTTFMVPTHLVRLLAHPGIAAADLGRVRLLAHAGAPCPEPLKRQVMDRFPRGAVWEFYGSTEGQFTVCSPQDWLRRPGTVGRARHGETVTVRAGAGRIVRSGEVGRVWVTADRHARFGYWRDLVKTAEAWRDDRFTVGDLGRMDEEGFLTLVGRPGDLIITGGVNVYPAEVERVLATHPAVAESAVYGVPDREWGERVIAAVVPVQGARAEPEELRQWVRLRVSPAQAPKVVHVVDDLPRTTSGKVLRLRLSRELGG